jgi:type I restriction enzyme S subunit
MEAVDDEFAQIAKFPLKRFDQVAKGYTIFAENDVIVAKITPCMENGKCAVVRNLRNGIGFGSTEFHVLRATTQVLPEWLFYFWRFPKTREHAEKNMTGTAGQKRVPSSFLERLDIPVPPLREQERITTLLEKADRLRRTRRYARQLSDTFLQSVFLEMFGDLATNSKGWDIEPFEDSLEDIEAGVNFKPIADNEPASPWRVLKVSAVTSGEFNPYESKPISPDIVPSKKLIVRNGDFLMSRANTVELVGAVCRVRTAPPMVLLPDKLWRVKFANASKLDADYALILLQNREMRRRIGSVATGTSGSMKNITQDDAASLLLPIPPLPLQQKFAGIVRRFERLRAQQREAQRHAEHLFQTLLHRAFNGEL